MVTWVRILPHIFLLPFKQNFQHCVSQWYGRRIRINSIIYQVRALLHFVNKIQQKGWSEGCLTGGQKAFLSFFKAKRSSLILFGGYHQTMKLPNQCPTKKLRRFFSWVLMRVEPGSIKNYLPRRDRLLLQAIEIYGSVFQALSLDIGYLFGISLPK